MATLAIPYQDPDRFITAPLNPRGSKAARALNQLYTNASVHFPTPSAIVYPATHTDVEIGIYKNELKTGIRHVSDTRFYQVWPDDSALVGTVTDSRLTILPVALKVRQSLGEKLYTPRDRTQHTNYKHLDGLDFWLTYLDTHNPLITNTPACPIPLPWKSMNWVDEDTKRFTSDTLRKAASWLMVTSGLKNNSGTFTLDYRTQLRNGKLTPLLVQWWQSQNDTFPPKQLTQKCLSAAVKLLNTHPLTKGDKLLKQRSYNSKRNPETLHIKCTWDSASTHEHLERTTDFAAQTGL